jgi:hypothetical protein
LTRSARSSLIVVTFDWVGSTSQIGGAAYGGDGLCDLGYPLFVDRTAIQRTR